MCLYENVHMSAGAHESQKRSLDPQTLDLQAIMISHPTWVPGNQIQILCHLSALLFVLKVKLITSVFLQLSSVPLFPTRP